MKQMEVENLVTHLQFTDDNKSVLLKPLKMIANPHNSEICQYVCWGERKTGIETEIRSYLKETVHSCFLTLIAPAGVHKGHTFF